MTTHFIRVFADDLSDLNKKYRDDPQLSFLVNNVVMELHSIAHIIEEKEHVIESGEDSRE